MFPAFTSASLPFVAVAVLALALAARQLFKKDERIEDRRRQAIKLAGECQTCGLDFLAPLLEDYAVGDYSGILHRLRALAEDVRNDAQRQALLDRVFETQLAARLKTPESRQQLALSLSRQGVAHAALMAELARQAETAPPAEA